MDDDEVDIDVEEEIVLRIVRPPGTGLGISIAGGVGSTPFRDNDEVNKHYTSLLIDLFLSLLVKRFCCVFAASIH